VSAVYQAFTVFCSKRIVGIIGASLLHATAKIPTVASISKNSFFITVVEKFYEIVSHPQI
jgi:hypothetical protein